MLTSDLSLKIENLVRKKSRNENEFRSTMNNFTQDFLRDIVIKNLIIKSF